MTLPEIIQQIGVCLVIQHMKDDPTGAALEILIRRELKEAEKQATQKMFGNLRFGGPVYQYTNFK